MSAIVPLRRSAIRRLLPSTGSQRVGSPASPVLRDAPIPCRPSRRTSLPSLGGTDLRSRFAPAGGRALPPWARDLVSTGCPSCRLPRGGGRASQVPGEPHCAHALLSDPGGTSAPGHLGASVLPSANFTTSAPTITPFEAPSHGLHTRCLRFVTTVTRSHARLASDCWPALPGGIAYPLGSSTEFQSSLHLILPVQASPGARNTGARWLGQAVRHRGRGRPWGGPHHHVSPTRGPSARRPGGPCPLLGNPRSSPAGGCAGRARPDVSPVAGSVVRPG
jgi:hypothetical protein